MNPQDTIPVRIQQWLTAHPGWWSRLEISIGVGCKKSSHLARTLDGLAHDGVIYSAWSKERGRVTAIYAALSAAEDLPF